MKSLITGVCFLSILILASSCERNNQDESNHIVTGDYIDLHVYHHDTILMGGYYDNQSYDIDVNNDHAIDFRLNSYIFGSPATGMIPGSNIASLYPEAYLFAPLRIDTNFLSTSTQTLSGLKTEIYIYKRYTCERLSPQDSIISIKTSNEVIALGKGIKINKYDNFKSDTIDLTEKWYSYPPNIIYESIDTTIFQVDIYANDCSEFPNDKIVYIGIKVGEKLGWIKLSVMDNYRISILESVIQN